jgi:hypothetical protein
MRIVLTITSAALALGLFACGETQPEPTVPANPLASAKADCPDCDPAGPNAFVQAGIATSFYEAGQSWAVAYRYNHTPMAEMRGDVFLGEDEVPSEIYLFDYVARSVDRIVSENKLRQTVTVDVSQAYPTGTHGDLFATGRVDTYEYGVSFTMNDLLEPMRETVHSRRYPNGRQVELDSKSSLKTGASIFPRMIPRLLVSGSVAATAPELPADLRDVADQMVPGWESVLYQKYRFQNGDLVYWAADSGQLWPFYTRTRAGEGLLVAWKN